MHGFQVHLSFAPRFQYQVSLPPQTLLRVPSFPVVAPAPARWYAAESGILIFVLLLSSICAARARHDSGTLLLFLWSRGRRLACGIERPRASTQPSTHTRPALRLSPASFCADMRPSRGARAFAQTGAELHAASRCRFVVDAHVAFACPRWPRAQTAKPCSLSCSSLRSHLLCNTPEDAVAVTCLVLSALVCKRCACAVLPSLRLFDPRCELACSKCVRPFTSYVCP
ncbi:hypothetical protein TRVL_01833 [Trypanosoma vivax]|nr:hypothetical protein TRVL_01833 [Trypanosoma vivax]